KKMKQAKMQLFSVIAQMELTDYFSSITSEVVRKEANNIPFLSLPDGTPCLIGNAYMLNKYERRLSRRNHGGTLRHYASQISHIIRYCFYNKIDLIQVDNNRFIHFMNELRSEEKAVQVVFRVRNSNTLNNIGR